MEKPEEKDLTPARPERKTSSWLRAFLRWGLVILLAFALGAAFITFGFFLPKLQEVNTIKTALDENEALLGTKITEIEALTPANQILENELSDVNLRGSILNALAAVQAARLAIAEENDANATLLISGIIQALDELGPLVADKAQSEAVEAMGQEAAQAQNSLSTDPAAAAATLAQLNDSLQSMLGTIP